MLSDNTHEIKRVDHATCCIVGGGPAGAVLALLLARKGISVVLLEAHMDFDRDFRGDTISPAVMEIMDQLGLAERLRQIRHTEMSQFILRLPTASLQMADLTTLKTKYPFMTIMAQSRFLEFITEEAKHCESFKLVMGAQVDELLIEDGVVCGIRYRGQDGWYELRTILTVGADGRFSRLRKLAGFEPIKTSPPMDVLWFRLSRKESDPIESLGGRIEHGTMVILINRDDYWQMGYIIPKGGYQDVRASGLPALRQHLVEAVPELADRVDELKEWKQISVLSVESSRLPRWYRPGLLLIGDAAHVMSPVGGVGINVAIQDAVVAANVLIPRLQFGIVSLRDLAEIQRQRALPVRIVQGFQQFIQRRVLSRAMNPEEALTVPPFLRLFVRLPVIRNLPAQMIGFSPWRVHVNEAHQGIMLLK